MTTHVPEGTSEGAVQDIRSRESERSRQLATQGNLLRLWRPPRRPGEWRTLGLFAADDGEDLEGVLASMPLRVWRTDEVTPLSPHSNDPVRPTEHPVASTTESGSREFMTALTLDVPVQTTMESAHATAQRQEDRTRELARQGRLERLWTLPDHRRDLGLWRAHDLEEMKAVLVSLPLYAGTRIQTTLLAPHPNDPALTSR